MFIKAVGILRRVRQWAEEQEKPPTAAGKVTAPAPTRAEALSRLLKTAARGERPGLPRAPRLPTKASSPLFKCQKENRMERKMTSGASIRKSEVHAG